MSESGDSLPFILPSGTAVTTGQVCLQTGLPPRESNGEKAALSILLIFTILYSLFLASFYESANPGVDQNGYMLTARLVATHGKLSFRLHNPLQFAGSMIIQTPQGFMYAKYPPGVGVLGALLRFISGPSAMYLVDPLCTVMALIGGYFLFRRLLDPFLSLLGVILLATNPVTLTYADDSNSQGAALGFTVLGFWALLVWWEKGGTWRAWMAGIVLGFCCWMRYTEFLWLLPLLAVAFLRFSKTRIVRDSLMAIAGFALPVALLAAINWHAFGEPWRTGYWFCREQTGFSVQYLISGAHLFASRQGNWLTVIEQFQNLGLFLLFPMAMIGLCKLPLVYRRFGLVVLLWVLPTTLVYALYYWAPARDDTVGYLRFFLDTFPALILVALWTISELLKPQRWLRALAIGGFVMLAAGFSFHVMMPRLLAAKAVKISLLQTRDVLRKNLKPGSVVFAPTNVCNYLNSVGGFQLFDTSLFMPGMADRMTFLSARSGPSGLQKMRAIEYRHLLSQRAARNAFVPDPAYRLRQIELKIVQKAWRDGRLVVMLASPMQMRRIMPSAAFLQVRSIGVIDQSGQSRPHRMFRGRWAALNPRLMARLKQMRLRRQLMRQWDIVELLPKGGPSADRLASAGH